MGEQKPVRSRSTFHAFAGKRKTAAADVDSEDENPVTPEAEVARVRENPKHGKVRASSAACGQEYEPQTAVAALCEIKPDEDLLIVPSLHDTSATGRYTLHVSCTEAIVVERVR